MKKLIFILSAIIYLSSCKTNKIDENINSHSYYKYNNLDLGNEKDTKNDNLSQNSLSSDDGDVLNIEQSTKNSNSQTTKVPPPQTPINSKTQKLNKQKDAYLVVIIHGLDKDENEINGIKKTLTNKFKNVTVIAPIRSLTDDSDMEAHTSEMVAIIKSHQAKKKKIILIGHSFGGILTMKLLNKHSETLNIHSAIICNTPLKGLNKQTEFLKKIDDVAGQDWRYKIVKKQLISMIKDAVYNYESELAQDINETKVKEITAKTGKSLSCPLLVISCKKPAGVDFIQYDDDEKIMNVARKYIIGHKVVGIKITEGLVRKFMPMVKENLQRVNNAHPMKASTISGNGTNDLLLSHNDQQWPQVYKNKNIEQKTVEKVIHKNKMKILVTDDSVPSVFESTEVINHIYEFIERKISL